MVGAFTLQSKAVCSNLLLGKRKDSDQTTQLKMLVRKWVTLNTGKSLMNYSNSKVYVDKVWDWDNF